MDDQFRRMIKAAALLSRAALCRRAAAGPGTGAEHDARGLDRPYPGGAGEGSETIKRRPHGVAGAVQRRVIKFLAATIKRTAGERCICQAPPKNSDINNQ